MASEARSGGARRDAASLQRSVDSLTGELLSVYEELALLHSLSAKIGRLADEDQIAAVALREAMETLHADCGWVVVWDGQQRRVPPGCCEAIEAARAERISAELLEPLHYRGKRQVQWDDFSRDCPWAGPGAPARLLACFLPDAGASLGYLCVGRATGGRVFTSAEQKLIGAVASLAAVSLENVRLRRSELEKVRLEDELRLARTVQQGLLPRDFACSDFLEAQGISVPCYEIGGDYFDLLPIGPDQCLLVMADVSGKGPAAALQATLVQGIVHAVSRNGADLARMMDTISECIRKRAVRGSFATAFLATLDRAGRLVYSNGGHNPPLWIGAGGRVLELREGGPLLGFLENAAYQQCSLTLEPGDLLVLYTDGVTEAANCGGEQFGSERLSAWAARQARRSPEEVQNSLMAAVNDFSGARPQADDLTVLVVRFTGRNGP